MADIFRGNNAFERIQGRKNKKPIQDFRRLMEKNRAIDIKASKCASL